MPYEPLRRIHSCDIPSNLQGTGAESPVEHATACEKGIYRQESDHCVASGCGVPTTALVLPTDLFPSGSVASVSGMSGTGAGIGTIISTFLIGYVADHYSFNPVLIAASTVPLVATALVLWLLRGTPTGARSFSRRA
jgi:hypothetical protein